MSVQTEEKKRPEISVIVPVYNVAPYLSACLDSILAQTFGDFELILVDDGSTDGSREIAEEYEAKDARVRLFHHRWNKGTAATYGSGLELSRGRYVAFLDADDIALPEYLAVLHHEMIASNADIVAAGYQTFLERPGDSDIQIWTRNPVWLGKTLQDRLHAFLPLRIHIAPWSKLYRKSFLDAHHLTFFSPGIAPDLTFHLECLLVTQRYLVLPQVLYHYRRRQDSVEHVQGIVRAEKYAQGMPALMNALDVWMQAEPQLADSEVFRRQALQRLYLFLLVNLQRITKECSPLEVSRLLQAAMDETPSRPLQEAMTYAAIRIPVTEDALEYE